MIVEKDMAYIMEISCVKDFTLVGIVHAEQ